MLIFNTFAKKFQLFSQSSSSVSAKAIRIIYKDSSTGNFKLDENSLKKILFHPKANNKELAVVSICGTYRKGKSFLLNFILKYLQAHDSEDWLSNKPLNGFKWSNSCERETDGVYMWSEPLIKDNKAVFLMDTQGLFDSSDEQTFQSGTFIFAFSLLVSSLQIYNLMQNIHENDLDYLNLFTQYARFATEDDTLKNELVFLVRDWPHPHEYSYGYDDGQKYLESRLTSSKTPLNDRDLCRLRLRKKFDSLKCFLMPHPGLNMIKKKNFNGEISELDCDFVEYLYQFIKTTTIPSLKLPQKVLFDRFKTYFDVLFNSNDKLSIELTSISSAIIHSSILIKKNELNGDYFDKMSNNLAGLKMLDTKYLQDLHENTKNDCLKKFEIMLNKFDCGFELKKELNDEIEASFKIIQAHNGSKSSLLLEMCIVFYKFFLFFLAVIKFFMNCILLSKKCVHDSFLQIYQRVNLTKNLYLFYETFSKIYLILKRIAMMFMGFLNIFTN